MEVVEPNGLRRAYTYDGRGQVVEEYLASPAKADEQDIPWKLMLTEEFDGRGRKSSTVRYDYPSTEGKEQMLAQRCMYSYDLWGTETQRVLDTGRGASTDEDALTGFNGEYRDADNDQYPLGNGYRWYAPDAMCFHRQDDASPFGEGGSNAYAYCDGDPVDKQDPMGNLGVFAAVVVIVGAFFSTYMFARVTNALFGEKASKIMTAGLWAGIGVLTAIATGGLSLFAYAAVVALSVVAFATAVASVALDGIDDTASTILGWISLATTVTAGVVGAVAKAAGLAAKAMKELSTKLGKRADRCLNHLSHLRRASRYRPAMSASPRSAITPTRSLQAGRGAGGGEDVLARMSDPAFRSQSKWYDSLRVFDSSDANTLVCTTTGVLGMTGVFESDNAADVNGQLNNETWLPWGNWKGFMKTFTRRG